MKYSITVQFADTWRAKVDNHFKTVKPTVHLKKIF